MNKIAEEINEKIKLENKSICELLSQQGLRAYFPKGIITQSNEAKEKAHLYNATVGIAKENKGPMFLNLVRNTISPEIKNEDIFPYAATGGRKQLRILWQQRLQKLNPDMGNISLPIVTQAITHGLSLLGSLSRPW